MFCHVQHGNADSTILNLDCRCSILVDHMYRKMAVEACSSYVQTKTAEVEHATKEIMANLEYLNTRLEGGNAAADLDAAAAAAADEGAAAATSADADAEAATADELEDMRSKVQQLEELLKTRAFQAEALKEAAEKLRGVCLEEIDVCDDTGTALGLAGMGSLPASDVLDSRGRYTLCRRVKPRPADGEGDGAAPGKNKAGAKSGGAKADGETIVMLSFAVPPDSAVNLELLLGPSRIKVSKQQARGGKHRRSVTERPRGKKDGRRKGLQDITNKGAGRQHRRAATSAV